MKPGLGESVCAAMTRTRRRNLYLLHPDDSVLEALQAVLAGDLYNIQTYTTTTEFETALDSLAAGIVLLSADLPDGQGKALLQTIKNHRPDLPVVMIFDHNDMPAVVDSMRLGAIDCLQRPFDRKQVSSALFHASYVDTGTIKKLSGNKSIRTAQDIEACLTRRQFQVLEYLLAGMKNKHIGEKLKISERTVEIHRSNIMRRLDVSSFAALVRLATLVGIEPD